MATTNKPKSKPKVKATQQDRVKAREKVKNKGILKYKNQIKKSLPK